MVCPKWERAEPWDTMDVSETRGGGGGAAAPAADFPLLLTQALGAPTGTPHPIPIQQM